MYFPTTSSTQSANKSAHNTKETTFKTSNPQIFPSLNPLGALYKQRKVVHPNPLVHEHSDAPELVKKVKLTSGVQERVSVPNNGFTQQPQQPREDVDKDGFRMPKLPKRLANQSQRRQGLEKQTNKGFKMVKESNVNKGKTQGKISEQNLEALYQGVDPLNWTAIYEQFRLEYIAFQMRQNAEMMYYMYQNNQNNQFNLSESLMKGKINQVVRC
jgi:hypothetical protein